MKGDPDMKRFVRSLFAVLMVLLLFVGCSEPQEENEEPSAPNRNAVLKAVLKGETEFYNFYQKTSMSVNALPTLYDGKLRIVEFTVLDMDGDGVSEAVFQLGKGEDDYFGFLVLHVGQERATGYEFSYRSLIELKADGTHTSSSGAAYSYTYRLAFDAKGLGYHHIQLDISDEEQDAKKDADWCDFTEAEIDRLLG